MESISQTASYMIPTKFHEKYMPRELSDIIGTPNVMQNIMQWLTDFKKEKYKCMTIIGPHGSGKSCRIMLALQKLNIIPYMFGDVKTNLLETPHKFLQQLASGMDILSFMNGGGAKKNAIIIDEIDVELLTHEKKKIVELMKINNKKEYCPIIFVFDTKHNKLINSLKKGTKEIRIYEPSDIDMMKLLQKIIIKERITLDDCEVSNKIIEFAQHDYRRLCSTMCDLINDLNNLCNHSNVITMKQLDEYLSIMCEKNILFELYRSCNTLLTNYQNIDECMKLYQIEKVNIPQMVQYNYIHKIIYFQDLPIMSNKLKYITNALSIGDIVDNYIFGEQRWDLTNIHGLFSCCIPSYHLNAFPKTYYKLPQYSVDMNKTSTKKLNKKHIIGASKTFDSVDPIDYVYMSKILCHLVVHNQFDELIEIMKTYDLSLEKLENTLKIDKNNTNKPILTAKQKKILKNI